MDTVISFKQILGAVIFSVIGLGVLGIAFYIFDKLTPGTLWKEIIEEHNIALAITVGAFTIAIAQIIAAAMHG